MFREALGRILEDLDDVEVARQWRPGRFDVAIVDEGDLADADLVIELLGTGGLVAVHREGEDRIIDLRGVSGLVDVVAAHLGITPSGDVVERDLQHDAGPAA